MKPLLRKLTWVLLGVIVLGGLVYAFLPQPISVDVAPVVRGPLQITVDEDGKTRICERYVVSTPLTGNLLRVELDAGDSLVAGETVLATLEPTDPNLLDIRTRTEAEARVHAAHAAMKEASAKQEHAIESLELAQHDYDRAKQLIKNKNISREEFDRTEHGERMARAEVRSAEFALQVARYEHEVAKAALIRTQPTTSASQQSDRFELRSPINGRVLRVFQESAAVVPAGTRLMEIGDPTDLEIEIDVLSPDAVKIRPGAKVILEQWGGDEPLEARVRLVEPSAFLKVSALGVEEQRVNVIADFVDAPEKRPAVGDAYRIEARIVIWEAKDVLKVPAGALFREGNDWAVFLYESGRAKLQKVQSGKNNGLEAEVRVGLTENAQVIVNPSDRVRDDILVAPR